MAKSKKSSKKSSSLKNQCEVLGRSCRDCCNHIIDMLCVCKDNCRKDLCDYLKCCLALCEVCNCCCCCLNMDCMSPSMNSDLKSKCLEMSKLCDKLKKVLTPAQFKKIDCGNIKMCCGSICSVRKSSKKSKKGVLQHIHLNIMVKQVVHIMNQKISKQVIIHFMEKV